MMVWDLLYGQHWWWQAVAKQSPVFSHKTLWEKLLTVIQFFVLFQGNYPLLFPFRQWAAKLDVQQPRLHFHPGWASTANCGLTDPGETFDLVQWHADHRQVQVRNFQILDLKCGISPFHLKKFFLVLMFHTIFLKDKVVFAPFLSGFLEEITWG